MSKRIRARGFTLVEIMVAMLIGLVAVIVIMQTYAVSEGFKRTSSSGSDAQTNGGIALYLMERELRMAGYGFNAIPGCTSIAVYTASTATTTSIPVWPPVQVNPAGIAAGDANTDVILVAYGSADNFPIPVKAFQSGGQSSSYTVSLDYNSIRTGDMLVAYNTGGTCILTEATGVFYSAGNCSGSARSSTFNAVDHANGSYRSSYQSCNPVNTQHNPSGGVTDPAGGGVVAPLAASTGWLFNLGGSPQVKAYAIRGGNLTVCDLLAQNCSLGASFSVVMNDVVSLRAVLGQDQLPAGNPDGVIDTWSRAAGNAVAVALEVSARSPLKEKPSNGGTTCDATAVKSKPDRTQDWFGPTLTPADATVAASQIDLSALTDWQCYRYKLFQTTVPLRNVIWTPTNTTN